MVVHLITAEIEEIRGLNQAVFMHTIYHDSSSPLAYICGGRGDDLNENLLQC